MALFSPWGNQQFFDDNGNPATGWKIYAYAAGSNTPLATFTTSAGDVAQSKPIILNSLGFPTNGQIFLTSGLAYKLVLTNASDVVKKTADDITGVTGTSTTSQWQASGLTPTYVSATSFTLSGDQTSTFHVGRRLQSTTTAGTIYSTITATDYTTLTTVTVSNDSGALDSGLSAVNYGMLSAVNQSITALAVVNTPAGNIAATTVQAALNELDAEKALLAGSASQAFSANTLTAAGNTKIKATRSTAQSIAHATDTIIIYPTEVYDILAEYDTATGRATIGKAGYYHVHGQAMSASVAWDAGEYWYTSIFINGVAATRGLRTVAAAAGTFFLSSAVDGDYLLAAGDIVDIRTIHNQGAAVDTHADSLFNQFSIHRIP